MKNFEIKATLESLESISSKMPVRVSFKIAKNIRTLNCALEVYNSEHDRIVRKYAADGLQVRQTDDFDAFKLEIIELNNLDAGIELESIKYEDIEDLVLSVPQTAALMYMIDEKNSACENC